MVLLFRLAFSCRICALLFFSHADERGEKADVVKKVAGSKSASTPRERAVTVQNGIPDLFTVAILVVLERQIPATATRNTMHSGAEKLLRTTMGK